MDFLKVLGFQLEVILDCDYKNEFLIDTLEFRRQLEFVKNKISEKKPDLVIIPEMCYASDMSSYYKEISKGMLVVAGSIYNNGFNETVIFHDSEEARIVKRSASGAEPMARFISNCEPGEFLNKYLEEHTFFVKGKKIVVLNCMEYYKYAYYIARSVPDLFGIVCICSNNNTQVFLDETKAIHNHVENIYTFMVNASSIYRGRKYAHGESYVYGPIQGHEKEWLGMSGVMMDENVSSILKLGSESEYFYGEFRSKFSRFGRSDEYINSPRGIEVGLIRKKELK